jgi:hypothetical protein
MGAAGPRPNTSADAPAGGACSEGVCPRRTETRHGPCGVLCARVADLVPGQPRPVMGVGWCGGFLGVHEQDLAGLDLGDAAHHQQQQSAATVHRSAVQFGSGPRPGVYRLLGDGLGACGYQREDGGSAGG